jgi:conjugal transfer pilus assembly protein TraW
VKFELMVCTAALLFLVAGKAPAEHRQLAAVGPVYPVVEPDLVEELRARALAVDVEGIRQESARYQPASLHQLPRARVSRRFAVDMTYTLEQELRDGEGRVLYPKGYTFNPLEYVGLSGGLVVIDGGDAEQVAWFKASPYHENRRAKLLLSGGYASDLATALERPVFYLTEVIAKRLRLQAVPSVIVEERHQLHVQEVALEEG